MSTEASTIGITLLEDEKFSSGIGYIALPSDIDRQTYLLDCYQNLRVSIHTAHDGFMNRVTISEDDLNWIEFPIDYTQFGTMVYYITNPITNEPVIVKRYGKKSKLGTGSENTFSIGRGYQGSLVEISGNPQKGFLNLVVSNDNQAQLNINILNKSDSAALNLNVKGSVNVVATEDVNFSANGQYYTKVFDPENTDTKTEIIQSINYLRINAPNISINNGKENFVLGQQLKTLLTNAFTDMANFAEEISGAQVTTMIGVQPLINASSIEAFNDKFKGYIDQIDNCLSQVAYIDK